MLSGIVLVLAGAIGEGGAGAFAGGAGALPTEGAEGGAGGTGAEGGGGTVATGAVTLLGATGPASAGFARKLIRTVSFFRGTVDVAWDGFGRSESLIGKMDFLKNSFLIKDSDRP